MSETEYQVFRARLEKLYRDLLEIESQLHPLITRLRIAIGEFLGISAEAPTAPPPAPTPPAETRRMKVAEIEVAAPPPRPPTIESVLASISRLLSEVSEKGFKLRQYTDHKFIIAPEEITYEGAMHDLGLDYNAAILVPSIDARIEINKPVGDNTPVILARTALNLDNMVIREIYYKGLTPGLVGTMSIWAFRW
ncbi:MAG: hypothetical protein QXL22_01000 [Candidatus Nezhaarchaeales archaeon]